MNLFHSFFCSDSNKNRSCAQCDPVNHYHDIIVSIITALEAKDACTASHSYRVSDMTERFCIKLGLTAAERNEIHMAAHVHDIGKIGIADAILRKSSSLDADEWQIIKSHPEIGSNILRSSGRLTQ